MKQFALLIIVLLQILHSQTIPNTTIQHVEYVRTMDNNGVSTCTEYTRTEEYIKNLHSKLQTSELFIIPQTIGRKNLNGTHSAQQIGLDIILRGTQQLLDNPAAVNAFAAAAAAGLA